MEPGVGGGSRGKLLQIILGLYYCEVPTSMLYCPLQEFKKKTHIIIPICSFLEFCHLVTLSEPHLCMFNRENISLSQLTN